MAPKINNNNNNVNQQLSNLQNEVKQLKDELANQKKRSTDLESRVQSLESFKTINERVTEKLKREVDRLDQYGRRSNVTIKYVPLPEGNEEETALANTINNILSKDLGLANAAKDIDKMHRVGKPKTHNGVRQQNVIVRFKSHATRYRVYNARRKAKKVKICPNLTKIRNDVLYNAVQMTNEVDGVDFVLADIHGDLKVKLRDKFEEKDFFKFETIQELSDVLIRAGLINDEEENKD